MDVLPDDVLLIIFHFCRVDGINKFGITWEWEALVQVCQRWRHLIFASPRGLDLRLVCTRGTPVQEMLDIWPAIPIVILDHSHPTSNLPVYNVVTALEHRHRVYGIWLNKLKETQWQLILEKTQEQFPELTFLELVSEPTTELTLPLEFLGGSAPSLRVADLDSIRFPALPHLLSSARDLVSLRLRRIPIEGYVSPMAMVASLSASVNLRELLIDFRSPQSPLNRTILLPRPRKHVVLPALTNFSFHGVSEYLEDFVARIRTPSLHHVQIRYFNQLIFHIPQLVRFIKQTENLGPFDQAYVHPTHETIVISLQSSTRGVYIALRISCYEMDWKLSSLAQLCSQLYSLVSRVECLEMDMKMDPRPNWQDGMDAIQWLEIFQTFAAVNTLRLGRTVLPSVLSALEGLNADSAAEMLPALRDLSFNNNLEKPSSVREAIKRFLSARRHSDCTVAVHRWKR